MEVTNKYMVIKHHFKGAPQVSYFDFKTEAFVLSVEPGCDDIIVKNLYISVDPYQINRMKSESPSHSSISAAMRINPSEAFDAPDIGKVVASGNAKFQKDDLVMGTFTLAEYSLVKEGSIIHKIGSSEFPLSYHLGIDLVDYQPMQDFSKCADPRRVKRYLFQQPLDPLGNLVGQYAKILGCYVVGCAGSQKKVALLKEKLGFDDAFNIKEYKDLNSTLKRASHFWRAGRGLKVERGSTSREG
ncbi:2-alkenal reductase (NADP(+)-dependent), partial [Mucuna pruriens]